MRAAISLLFPCNVGARQRSSSALLIYICARIDLHSHNAQDGRVGPLPPHMRGMRARSAAGVCTPLALFAPRRAGSGRAMGVLARIVLAQGILGARGQPSSPSRRRAKARADLCLGLRRQPCWSLRLVHASCMHSQAFMLQYKLRKPNAGNQPQKTKLRKPTPINQTQETKVRKPNLGNQT
jgi:hypothetical protein